jgi:hypothetical protein
MGQLNSNQHKFECCNCCETFNRTTVKPIRVILDYKDIEDIMKHFVSFIQWIGKQLYIERAYFYIL